jgi:hypothetical protein
MCCASQMRGTALLKCQSCLGAGGQWTNLVGQLHISQVHLMRRANEDALAASDLVSQQIAAQEESTP